MSGSQSNELVSAIYAATLSPRDFDKTFDTLDNLLFVDGGEGTAPALSNGDGTQSRSYEPLLPHIELAREIQQRVGREKTRGGKQAAILEAVPNPSWLIDGSGKVVAANELAFAKFGGKVDMLEDCISDVDARQRVQDFISSRKAALESDDLLIVAGYNDIERDVRTSILVKRVAGDILDNRAGDCFLLTVVDFGFDRRVTELFREAYALTDAEAQVAVLLATGLSRPDIAARRGVSVETVNTQIKIIKQKTSMRDVAGLVRLLCGFSAGLLVPFAGQESVTAKERGSIPLKSRHYLALSDGRRLEYLEQGAANGEAVLLLHNMPYGADLPAGAIRRAYQDNLRFIAPYRPGCGDTDPVREIDNDAYLDRVARDADELLAHLGIARAVVVAHTVGGAYALRFARLFPDRVSGLVAVARAPIWRDEWLKQSPQRQRFIQRLARNFPQMLPVVSWAMISCLERGFAREFVTYCCKDGKVDSQALKNTETLDLIVQGSIDGMRQGTDGFCRDSILSITDFAAEAKITPHKFHILHGSDDRIVDISQSRTFAEEVPGTRLEVVEGAGQLLFYSHWPRVLDAIEAKLAKK